MALTSEACLKGLPKTAAGEVVAFKGWPKLHWFVTEHLGKTPKDWLPPPRLTDETPAYIEYTTDKDGSVMGVTVTRSAMLTHCRALTQACGYTEGENAVCVLDFKREVGLWHSTLTSVLNGMHVIFIPYALMKVNPASWMQMIDHEAPRQRSRGEIARPSLGSPGNQGPQRHLPVVVKAAAGRRRCQSLVPVLLRPVPFGVPVERLETRCRLSMRILQRGSHRFG